MEQYWWKCKETISPYYILVGHCTYIVVGVIGCKCKKYVYVVYKRTVHLSYICIYAEQQKVLRKGGLRCSGCGRAALKRWYWIVSTIDLTEVEVIPGRGNV